MSTSPLKPLLILLLIFLAAVGYAFDTLLGYFNSYVYVNGIVVSVGLSGLSYVLFANIRLHRIVSLFRETEKTVQKAIKEESADFENFEKDWEHEFESADYAEIMERKSDRLKWIMSDKDVAVLKNWAPTNLFTHDQAETALSAVRLRIAEARNFSNYFSGILIILGLLGTFLGLLETIKAIGLVFSGDSISFLVTDKAETSADDILKFFDAISAPLGGMGIAFSSSLFGLSGSLIVGLFAFISARNQSFFLFDLFDWFKDRMDQDEAKSLNRGVMATLPSASGLMGSLVRGGMRVSQGQPMRSLGTGIGDSAGTGIDGAFKGEFKGDFRGEGELSGKLDADSLTNVLGRLEAISRDAVEKNGLLAKAALKLGENLALEQKRLADIATYEQQSSVALSALRQQGEQQIHLLNQQIEAAYNTTDKEEFRALAAHFHRSFQILLSDVKTNNMALHDRINRLDTQGSNVEDDPSHLASVPNQEARPLSSDDGDDEDKAST